MAGHVRKRSATEWIATYYDPDGRRRAKSFRRKLDADNFLAGQTVKVLTGEWIDPKAGRITVGTYARTWLDSHLIRDSTMVIYERYLRYMLDGQPALRNVPIGDLRTSTLREWQKYTAGRYAISTTRSARSVFASILGDAVIDRLIAVSPFVGLKMPKEETRELVVPLSVGHVIAVRETIVDRYAAAITAGAGTGVRRSECFGLTKDRVDFLRRVLTVDRQLIGTSAGRPVFGPPKTVASVRRIPMPQHVVDALAAHMAAYPPGPDGLIFTGVRGGPVSSVMSGEAWLDAEVRIWAAANGHPASVTVIPKATRGAWAQAHPDGHGHRFHELRHFYASALIRAGESVKVVQARLGHKTATETLDTYAHLWPDDEDRTRAALDAVFAIETDDKGSRESAQ